MRIYQKEDYSTYKSQYKMSLLGFTAESSNLFFVVLNAIRCNSVLIWSDVVECTSAALHTFLVTLISSKIKNDISDEYNYGIKRLEIFVSFICDILVVFGMFVVFCVSIYGLFNPQQPEDNLIRYVLLKLINTLFDLLFVFQQYNIYKIDKSPISKTELSYNIYCATMDFLYMLIGLFCYLFRDSIIVAYINPIVTLIFVIYFAYRCIKRIKKASFELADHSISIKDQDELFDIVLSNSDTIKKIKFVNCHMLNNVLRIDINVDFKTSITYKKQCELLKIIDLKVKEKYPNSITNFLIGEE